VTPCHCATEKQDIPGKQAFLVRPVWQASFSC